MAQAGVHRIRRGGRSRGSLANARTDRGPANGARAHRRRESDPIGLAGPRLCCGGALASRQSRLRNALTRSTRRSGVVPAFSTIPTSTWSDGRTVFPANKQAYDPERCSETHLPVVFASDAETRRTDANSSWLHLPMAAAGGRQ